ncbi:hypothetical protein HYH02_007377 [Chlamydomonas schloesseri]|uniref:Prokaryotic-type class I peptide chain release factors domain-containing protein n=1 Tax=Chlamydomonas schloesseri TaxID=2026947 RepID=A0A836B5K1_9CHLO|nr:hypothetical protein HYH02_007377 [Chlamydomonas schloesseri]|eukprot:KAG2447924.1 hypothetical protein HYH02_007377 [Chlamydomonas schloesseri]
MFGAASAILSGPGAIGGSRGCRGYGTAATSSGQRLAQSGEGEGDDRDQDYAGHAGVRSPTTPAGGEGAGALQLLSPALEERLRRHADRYTQLEQQLASGSGSSSSGGGGGGGGGAAAAPSLRDLGREYARLQPLAHGYSRLLQVRAELSDLAALARDPDAGVRDMAAEEEAALRQEAADLTRRLLLALVPPDPAAARPALLEVRAGAGGAEAALFASELLAMYRRLAQSRGWTWEVLELGSSEHGGVRHATVSVSDPAAPSHPGSGSSGSSAGDGDAAAAGGPEGAGEGVYGVLSGESGVHRVQRVPVTDAGGRLHTSTAAVVVLPQADEVDVRLREEDLRVETMRASGAGGQHVNVTDSAVRVTHLPTGLVVSCQNERSQHLNRAAALKVLRSRLYELEAQKRARAAGEQRSALVATADRSERVRTYNFPQGRVTDHRIHLTVHDLASVLEAGEGLQRLMEGLRAAREEAALAALLEEGRQ